MFEEYTPRVFPRDREGLRVQRCTMHISKYSLCVVSVCGEITVRFYTPDVRYSLDRAVEMGALKLESANGKLVVRERLCGDTAEAVLKETRERSEKLAFFLTMALGNVFTVKDVDVVITAGEGGKKGIMTADSIKIRDEALVVKQLGNDSIRKIEEVLRQDYAPGELVRALKYIRRGLFEEDHVDKFLNCYIAFELLAAAVKLHGGEGWITNFCSSYGIKCEFGGYKVNEIRAALVHPKMEKKEKGKELSKEQAEELARAYAGEFCNEVFAALRRITQGKDCCT